MKIFIEFSKQWLLPMLLFLLLWLVLTDGEWDSLIVGLPTIALALFTIKRLHKRNSRGIRAGSLPGFAVWFLWNSLRGGVDVALRTFKPRLPLHPGFVRYPLNIQHGNARIFLVNIVSLLPGTLSADLEGDELVLHCLDTGEDISTEMGYAEQHVALLFGLPQH
jgi:multicomponent Na+:H+ antiporter subunit E